MLKKFNAIFDLDEMLEDAGIPHTFRNESYDVATTLLHIYYPSEIDVRCSVIEGSVSYGGDEDLLEIQGLLSPEEHESNSVLGYLPAEEVFMRIKLDWKSN